eukprot:gene14157-13949_t
MMKKILLTAAAIAAVAAAVPAAAQSYDRDGRDGRGGYDQTRDYNRDGRVNSADREFYYAQVRDNRDGRGDRYDRDGRDGRYDSREYQTYRWNDGSRREWIQARRIDERQAALAERIDNAARRRAISPGEARNFFFKLRNIEQMERGYKRHNRDLSRAEVRNLNYRLDLLTQELRYKART